MDPRYDVARSASGKQKRRLRSASKDWWTRMDKMKTNRSKTSGLIDVCSLARLARTLVLK